MLGSGQIVRLDDGRHGLFSQLKFLSLSMRIPNKSGWIEKGVALLESNVERVLFFGLALGFYCFYTTSSAAHIIDTSHAGDTS